MSSRGSRAHLGDGGRVRIATRRVWAGGLVALVAVPIMGIAAATLSARGAGAAPTVTNFPTPYDINHACDLTTGPDGALWFTNFRDDSIGRMQTDGTLVTYKGTGVSHPCAIVVGPDGAVWFTNNGNNSIGRITTSGTITNFTGTGIAFQPNIETPGVLTRAALVGKMHGFYTTSHGYYVYHRAVNPTISAHLSPNNKAGEKLCFPVQANPSGTWRTLVRDCFPVDAAGAVSIYLTGSKATGIPYRIEVQFTGDSANAATSSRWIYFRFT